MKTGTNHSGFCVLLERDKGGGQGRSPFRDFWPNEKFFLRDLPVSTLNTTFQIVVVSIEAIWQI